MYGVAKKTDYATHDNGPQAPAVVNLAEGAKNLWVTPSLGTTMYVNVCTYNVGMLCGEGRLHELMTKLGKNEVGYPRSM